MDKHYPCTLAPSRDKAKRWRLGFRQWLPIVANLVARNRWGISEVYQCLCLATPPTFPFRLRIRERSFSGLSYRLFKAWTAQVCKQYVYETYREWSSSHLHDEVLPDGMSSYSLHTNTRTRTQLQNLIANTLRTNDSFFLSAFWRGFLSASEVNIKVV